jgi:hypothetical protein
LNKIAEVTATVEDPEDDEIAVTIIVAFAVFF